MEDGRRGATIYCDTETTLLDWHGISALDVSDLRKVEKCDSNQDKNLGYIHMDRLSSWLSVALNAVEFDDCRTVIFFLLHSFGMTFFYIVETNDMMSHCITLKCKKNAACF